MWKDEAMRALWGLLCSWPLLHVLQAAGLPSIAVAVLLTVWMVPVWRLYRYIRQRLAPVQTPEQRAVEEQVRASLNGDTCG